MFLHPEFLLIWILVPVLWYFYWVQHQKTSQVFRTYFLSANFRFYFPIPLLILRTLSVFLVAIAMAGPFIEQSNAESEETGREIYFLLDVSASMNATDLEPSRLGKLKSEIKQILPQLKGEKVGLIAFTNFSYVQSPLTRDTKTFETYLQLVETWQFQQTGTDLRSAFAKVNDRFSADSSGEESARIVVLLTDGENFGTQYQNYVKRFRQKNITVIPVLVGTESGAQVPVLSEEGKPAGWMTNTDGTPAISKPNSAQLSEIAELSGSSLIKIQNNTANLKDLISQIREVRPSRLKQARLSAVNLDISHWFLIPALLFWGISIFLKPVRTND